jgi:hypothetical protein
MPWLAFARDFPWHPAPFRGRVTVMFKAGHVYFANRFAAEAALASAAARRASDDEIEAARELKRGQGSQPRKA